MADGGDTAEGGAPSTSEVDEQHAPLPIPSITSTVSGLPISPVYAGAQTAYPFKARPLTPRSTAFHMAHIAHVPGSETSRNVYIPKRLGSRAYRMEKKMEGTGELYTDPLDNFKPQKFKETEEPGTGEEKQRTKENPNKYRNAGKKAYREDNKGNTEASAQKQLRYTQG